MSDTTKLDEAISRKYTGSIRECGCRDEDCRFQCFTLAAAKPSDGRSRFIDDNCWTYRHYCQTHWDELTPEERYG